MVFKPGGVNGIGAEIFAAQRYGPIGHGSYGTTIEREQGVSLKRA